jgi:hypothetical protein
LSRNQSADDASRVDAVFDHIYRTLQRGFTDRVKVCFSFTQFATAIYHLVLRVSSKAFVSHFQTIVVQGAQESEWQFCPRPTADSSAASAAVVAAATPAKKKDKAGKAKAAGPSAADIEAAWERTASPEFRPSAYSAHLLVGLQLDITHAHRLLDLGPAADDKQAALAFRAFWGARSEMRRFKDGSILEAVLWADGADAASVDGAQVATPLGAPDAEQWPLTHIARHVLQRHIDLSPDAVRPLATQLFATLQPSLPAWQSLPACSARASPSPCSPACNIDPLRVRYVNCGTSKSNKHTPMRDVTLIKHFS